MSNMINISPNLWGPHLWKFMHYLTLSYPDNPDIQDVNKYHTFFSMIGEYLPCEKCRIHYKGHLQEYPLTQKILSSRDNLTHWLFNLHNIVNQSLNKKELTIKEFNDIYVNNINNNISNSNSNSYINTIIFVIIILIIIIPLIIYKKCMKK
jgi:hypothetical protein